MNAEQLRSKSIESDYNQPILDSYFEKIRNELSQQVSKVIIKGLELHGYKFDNGSNLLAFVSDNVKCLIFECKKVYTVKDVPFLEWFEADISAFTLNDCENAFNFITKIGDYRYLLP